MITGRRRVCGPAALPGGSASLPGSRAGTPAGGGSGSRRVMVLGGRLAGDGGSATAELAVSLPALILLVAVAVGAISTVRAQLECVDAAREAARAAARGESGEAAGRRVAPDGASVTVTGDGTQVRATVRLAVRPAGTALPGVEVAATAVAAVEPGAVP